VNFLVVDLSFDHTDPSAAYCKSLLEALLPNIEVPHEATTMGKMLIEPIAKKSASFLNFIFYPFPFTITFICPNSKYDKRPNTNDGINSNTTNTTNTYMIKIKSSKKLGHIKVIVKGKG
jgi:hypothetical protein